MVARGIDGRGSLQRRPGFSGSSNLPAAIGMILGLRERLTATCGVSFTCIRRRLPHRFPFLTERGSGRRHCCCSAYAVHAWPTDWPRDATRYFHTVLFGMRGRQSWLWLAPTSLSKTRGWQPTGNTFSYLRTQQTPGNVGNPGEGVQIWGFRTCGPSLWPIRRPPEWSLMRAAHE